LPKFNKEDMRNLNISTMRSEMEEVTESIPTRKSSQFYSLLSSTRLFMLFKLFHKMEGKEYFTTHSM
jgi:hypothetical protein